MDDPNESNDASGVRAWCEEEIYCLDRATSIRKGQLQKIMQDVDQGKMAPDAAYLAIADYIDTWGESGFPGVRNPSKLSDDEIVRQVEEFERRERLRLKTEARPGEQRRR